MLVTPTSYAKYNPALISDLEDQVHEVIYNPHGRPLIADELIQLLPTCDAFIAGLDEINGAAIQAADRLKVIARYGVGVDNVDLDTARQKGIIVTNTPGANSVSVAELALALMLCLARPIPAAAAAIKQGSWPRMQGLTLEGKTVGLVGFGSIGQQVARRLKAFDCRIIAYDPFPNEGAAGSLGVEFLPLGEVTQSADFLSLHCPLMPETRGMVNADLLENMKHGAFLINTARGELVNETALYEALQSGRLAGAALDVFAQQPPDAANPLLSLPQVIATPHMAAHTDGAADAMGRAALYDCLAVLRGQEPLHRVI